MKGRTIAAASLLALAVSGAARAGEPFQGQVATIGGVPVTAGEVRRELDRPGMKHRTLGLSPKDRAAAALEQIAGRRLAALDVEKRGLLAGPLGDRYQAVVIPAMARIYRRVRLDEIRVTDAEVDREVGAAVLERRRVSYIVTTEEGPMLEVQRRLRAGEEFGALAREYSEGPGAEKGGDVGWLDKGSKKYFGDEQWDEIFSLPKGGVTGVHPSLLFEGGVTIARVDDIQETRPEHELEAVRKGARERLREQRYGAAFGEVMARAKLTVREEALRGLASAGRTEVLASFEGGSVTAGVFRAYLEAAKLDPAKASPETLREQLRKFGEWAVVAATQRESLMKHPVAGEGIKIGLAEALLKVYLEEIYAGLSVTDEEIAKAYRERPERNRTPEQVELYQIRCATAEEAAEAAERIRRGEEFESVAALFAPTDEERRLHGYAGTLARGSFPKSVEEVIFSLKLMEVSRPVQTRGGFSLFQVRKKVPAKELTLAERTPAIRGELLEQRRSRLYVETFTRLRTEFPVVVDRAALEKV